ncbi:hypothetical protein OMD46_16385 [Pseudomonas sp. MDMC_285]|nr:hypothetical protein [Pseudomonas sp. MDMC_285]
MISKSPGENTHKGGNSSSGREEASAIMVAKAAIQASLKDPGSAKFGPASYKNGTVCGFVNAKNSFGAYSGEKAFYVNESRKLVGLQDSTPDFEKYWSELCSD